MAENKTEKETLQDWFESQTKYKTQKEFAKATGIPSSSISFYIRGVRKPLEEHHKILYEVTGLESYKSELEITEKKEEKKAAEIKEGKEGIELPLYIQLQNWYKSQTKWKSYGEIGRAAKIDPSLISKYFRGVCQPSKIAFQKLSRVIDLDALRLEVEKKGEEKKEIVNETIEKFVAKKEPEEIKISSRDEKVTELQKIISTYKATKVENEKARVGTISPSPVEEDSLGDSVVTDEKIPSSAAITGASAEKNLVPTDDIDLLLNQIKEIIQNQDLKIRTLKDENKRLRKEIPTFSGGSRDERVAHIEKLCTVLVEEVKDLEISPLNKTEKNELPNFQNAVDIMINNLENVRESGKKLWDIEIPEEDKERFYSKVKDTIILLDRLTDKLFKGRKKLIPQGLSPDMLSFLSKTIDSGGE